MPDYVYHRVPNDMVANELVPLYDLEKLDVNLFDKARSKYEGRMSIMEDQIPILNCRWNDVVFMMATSPVELAILFESILKRPFPPRRFYKIDVDQLTAPFVVETWSGPNRGSESYESFDRAHLSHYATIPELTKTYFRQEADRNAEKSLLYLYIPHLLYQGHINVSNAPILDLDNPN